MERFGKVYKESLLTIDSAQLTDIECHDLTIFVSSSIDPDDAARYTLERISRSSEHSTLEETLRLLRTDLLTLAMKMLPQDKVAPGTEAALRERDGDHCCITGSTDVIPTYIISPSIVDDEDLHPGGYLRPLLEASLTKEKTEQLFTLLEQRNQNSELKNAWLMTPFVQSLFSNGHFEIIKSPNIEMGGRVMEKCWWIQRTPPGEISPDLLNGDDTLFRMPSTNNQDTHPVPAELLLIIHGIISRRLHFRAVESKIKAGWPPIKQEPWTLGRTGRFFLRSILLFFPVFVRRSLYSFVNQLIEKRDPRQKRSSVKYLPFGLCLKIGRKNTANEANALLLAEKYTSINAPRLIDSVIIDEDSGFILMTKVFGDRLSDVFYRTTYEERKQIGEDLAKWIAQMRCIPNQKNYYLIADTLGGPISDHRFSGETWGPFNTVSDFTDRLTRDVLKPRDERPLSFLYEKKHEICFTHSDLHLTNLFVQRGRLSGIIDWENAGFKPEYWEFTRALWPYGGWGGACYIYRSAFGDKYEEEMEADVCILKNGPFIY